MKSSCIHVSPGLTAHAYCGIESALLDVIGKRYNLPIWQILGGKYRDTVRIYADCHAGEALESINCLLVPRTPHWVQKENVRVEERSVVSLKHHGWDASKQDHLTAESYAARAQQMASRGFSLLKFDVDVPTPYETDEYNRDLNEMEIEYAASLVQAVRRGCWRRSGAGNRLPLEL